MQAGSNHPTCLSIVRRKQLVLDPRPQTLAPKRKPANQVSESNGNVENLSVVAAVYQGSVPTAVSFEWQPPLARTSFMFA